MSLRTRLVAGMVLVAVVLAGVAAFLTSSIRARLLEQVDARLTAFADGDRGGPSDSRDERPAPGDDSQASDAYQGYVDAEGNLTTRYVPNAGRGAEQVPAIDPADLPRTGSEVLTTGSADGSVTFRVLARHVGDLTLITALPLDDVEATISQLVWVEVGGSLVILAALGAVGWWVMHLGIRPIKEMTDTATRIAAGDLDVRVPEQTPGTESNALAGALNLMLTRIQGALDERAASQERLQRFVADASHELRTPVTTIRGYAELYRRGALGDPAMLDDAMRRTEQEATRMGRLVEDMLVLAKLDQQRPLDRREVDVVALAHDAVTDARAAHPDWPVADVDTGSAVVIVSGDEDRLRQVLANVVGNALVHTGPDVPIEVRVRDSDTEVVVEVQDHGPGMDPELARRVTERFFRADPARSRHRGGSGLGLAIADAAVAAHGGSLHVDSRPGEGTTVRIVLPAASAPAPQGVAGRGGATSQPNCTSSKATPPATTSVVAMVPPVAVVAVNGPRAANPAPAAASRAAVASRLATASSRTPGATEPRSASGISSTSTDPGPSPTNAPRAVPCSSGQPNRACTSPGTVS
jgi:two-component system OmpR family sensor kinase